MMIAAYPCAAPWRCPAAERVVVTLAPHWCDRHVELIVMGCGCTAILASRLIDPRHWCAAVLANR